MKKPILATMLSCEGTTLSDFEKKLFSEHNPLGISLFGRNISSKTQLKQLISEIKECLERDDVLIAVDQEGGRVRRLTGPEFTPCISQKQIGKIYEDYGAEKAKEIVQAHAVLISQDFHQVGINWNYAPVIDAFYPTTSKVLAGRSFSLPEDATVCLAQTMIDTYHQQSICTCIKHLPSLAEAQNDPHLELPIVSLTRQQLQQTLLTAQQLKNVPAAMTAHILYTQIDDKLPATQSPKVIKEIIRQEIGFDGFLISDALDMHALKGSLALKTQLALDAGCDCICYCHGNPQELLEVCKNARPLHDKSLQRLQKMQDIIKAPHKTVDIPKLKQDYSEFSANLDNYDEGYDATEVLHQMDILNKGEKLCGHGY